MARIPSKLDAVAAILPDFEDDAEARATLLQQAMADPARGGDMDISAADVADDDRELIPPGGWLGHGYINRRTRLPLNCPVTPLGKLGDQFYFLNTLGEVHVLGPQAGKGHIDALFAGRPLYLCWAWPRWSMPKSKAELPRVTNWEAEQARQDLFAACAFKGTFELEDRVRGRGAWTDDDGSLIYHAGDAVMIGGKWAPPGEHGRFIYPGRPKIGRPSLRYEKAGEGSPGDLLLQGLHSWNWDRPDLDPRLALGWLMTALVGGALEQRPVAYVVGTEGGGKSTLQKLLRLVMNGALVSTSNTTQAGIYQKVKQDSVAVMVDEMEAKEDTRTTDKILELARIAYSGDKMSRGGKDGVGQEFAVMSSFLFSSIALPAMDSQDASRMAVLMLRERPTPAPGETPVDILKELGLRDGKTTQRIGQQLLRRMFKWFELEGGATRWERLRAVMRQALLDVGHKDRSADTFGALAAGCHVALRDEMPDVAELAQWQGWLSAGQLAETAGREATWERCFWHMMNAHPEALRNNTHHKSVGSAVQAFMRAASPRDALTDLDPVLKACGMAVSFKGRGAVLIDVASARLFVPFSSPPLHGVFEGTPWAGRLGAPGPWGAVLKQMPREWFEISTCNKALNRAAKGLMIELAKVIPPAAAEQAEAA